MAVDYYQMARDLAEILEQDGLEESASRLGNVVDEGVAATEILMALRWNTEELLKNEELSMDASNRAKSLIEMIEQALNG